MVLLSGASDRIPSPSRRPSNPPLLLRPVAILSMEESPRPLSSKPNKQPLVAPRFSGNVPKPRTVEDIFEDFSSRRWALIQALTADREELYDLCSPDKELLCLYGHANGTWELMQPEEMVPPDLPEPALGINLSRDKMSRLDWLTSIAKHSDAWLIAIVYYFGVFLDAKERMCLFNKMSNMPTVYESFVGINNKYVSARCTNDVPRSPDLMDNVVKNYKELTKQKDEEDAVSDQSFCAACGDRYHANGFWICCDSCHRWFHGRCVKITSSQADEMACYKCPDCTREEIGE